MIFVAGAVFSQKMAYNTPAEQTFFNTKPAFKSNYIITGFTDLAVLMTKKKNRTNFSIAKPVFLLNPFAGSVIRADHYTQNFGFFCKKELQFEKATKIPLRFRLGTQQYNDYLEGKPNTVNRF